MRTTEQYDRHHRMAGRTGYRSSIIWAPIDEEGLEEAEHVGYGAPTVGHAISTVAAYTPPSWLPTEEGSAIVRLEVHEGELIRVERGEVLDVEWIDAAGGDRRHATLSTDHPDGEGWVWDDPDALVDEDEDEHEDAEDEAGAPTQLTVFRIGPDHEGPAA